MNHLRSLSLCLAAGTSALLLASPVANASPVLGYTGGGFYIVSNNASLGYEFMTGEAITVTALDALDTTASGLSSYDNPGQVRLYDASGDVLASATITTSDSTEGSGDYTFYTTSVTPVNLAADTDYFIVENISGNNAAFVLGATGLTGQYGVSFGTGVGQTGFGLDPTSNIGVSGLVEDGYITADFDATPTPTPEPSSFALLFSGILGAGAMIRKRISQN